MGPIKTHGPTVLAAIEQSDVNKVTDILTNKFRDKQKTRQFLVSEVRRPQSESVGVPLLAAAALDNPSILRFLVNEHGADVNFVYEYGTEKNRKYQTAMLIAVKRDCYAMVDVIVSLGGDVNTQDQRRRTPLHHAVRRANRRMVRMLLFHGAMSNICDADGQLPLDVATMYGHQEIVKLLMRYGGDLYRPGAGGAGSTPIHAAAREGHANLLQMFGELYRADGNFMTPCDDAISRTPLHIAASHGNPDSVKALLEFCSADPNLKDSEGNGAIHCALANRCDAALGTPDEDDVVYTVQVLISHGVDYNRGNGVGDTALHLAARNGFTRAVQVLVESGCDILLLDNSGHRAVDLLAPNDEFSKSIIMAAMEERRIRSKAAVVPEVHLPGTKSKLHHPPGMRNHKSSSEIWNQEAPGTADTGTAVARPHPAVRKTKSVENLDQESDNAPGEKKSQVPDPVARAPRIRSNSVQGSEVTDLKPSDVAQTPGKRLSVSKQKKKEKKLIESEEPLETEPPPVTEHKKKSLKLNVLTSDTASLDRTTDSEEYLLNGDAKGHAKGIPPHVPRKTITKKSNSESQKKKEDSQPSLQAWLDEQARLLKEKEKADQGGPVAQSTPPTIRNDPLLKEHLEMSTNDSDSDANLLAEQRSKQKPPPPPKPKKVRNLSVSSAVNVAVQQADLPSVVKDRRVNSETTQNLTEVHSNILQRRDSQTSLTGIAQLGIGENSLCFEPASPVVDVIPSKANSRLNMSLDSARSNQSSKKNQPVPKARELNSKTGQKSSLNPLIGNSESESISSDVVTTAVPSIKMKQRPMSMIKDSDVEVLPIAARRMQPPATEPHSSFKQIGLVFEKAAENVSPAKVPGKTRPVISTNKDFVDHSNDVGKSSVANMSRNAVTVQKPTNVQQPNSQPKTAKQLNKAAVVQQPESSESEEEEEEDEDSEEESENSEEEDDDEEEESEEEDEEEEEEARPSQKSLNTSAMSFRNQEMQVVTFYSQDNPGFTVIGGNAEGIFVHSLDPHSEAARNGLSNGDQILRANGKRVLGLTKEEASQILRLPGGELTLHIRSMPDQYKVVMDNGGIGDGFFVQAQFNHDAGKKGELSIREGDIFSVTDTLLENSPGIWKAHKINAKKNEEHIGTIPNRQRADQIIVKQRLSQGKPDQRGGAFFRSFRRSKSAERNSKSQEEEERNSSAVISDVVSYQRVIQRLSENRRPVIVLGLFCDIVINMLIRDSPELFESPPEEVENSKACDDPVNVRLIRGSHVRGKHCLIILTPPAIEYLLQKSDLNPIVIYISPVSKSVVKAVKAKLAPNYNKNAGYMFDEAAKFEKTYGQLFSTSVAYTTDDWWFFHLKEAIGRMQNQPIWRTIADEELEASAMAELNKICPGVAVLPPIQVRKSRDKTPRFSRTTDDLPVPVQAHNVRGRPPLAGNRELNNKVEAQEFRKEMTGRSILKQRPPGGSISSDQVSIKSGIQKSMSVSFDEQEPSDMPKYITGKIPKPRNPTNTKSHETLL